jgi:hypothetical protein
MRSELDNDDADRTKVGLPPISDIAIRKTFGHCLGYTSQHLPADTRRAFTKGAQSLDMRPCDLTRGNPVYHWQIGPAWHQHRIGPQGD